jgi:hypothetical protein
MKVIAKLILLYHWSKFLTQSMLAPIATFSLECHEKFVVYSSFRKESMRILKQRNNSIRSWFIKKKKLTLARRLALL